MVRLQPALVSAVVLGLAGLGWAVHRLWHSRRARRARTWKALQRRFPAVEEGGSWIPEGYLAFEGEDLCWGSLAETRFEPHGIPLGVGEHGLHLHPWPVVQRPLEAWERRMKPLCVPWAKVVPGGDRFTWRLCENPPLLLHLTAEGARHLAACGRGSHPEVS